MVSEERERCRSSPGGPPAHPALGQWVSWKAQGTDWGLCPVGPQSPCQGPPLGIDPRIEVAVNFSPIPVSET